MHKTLGGGIIARSDSGKAYYFLSEFLISGLLNLTNHLHLQYFHLCIALTFVQLTLSMTSFLALQFE